MWAALARIALSFIPKDKLLMVIIFIPLAFIAFIGLLISGPGHVYKHIPLGQDESQFNYYINAAAQIQTETGISVNWQEIMAIDAVVLEQDFSTSSQSRAYGYKDYFIREEQKEVSCPESSTSDNKNSGGENDDSPPKKCYETVYHGRTFDEVLHLLVRDGVIKQDQIEDVKNYMLFSLTDELTGDHTGGGVHFEGNFVVTKFRFAWPLPAENSFVTSPFSTRIDPINGTIADHKGVDFRASIGTKVYAMDDATVVYAGEAGTAGIMVQLKHTNGMVSKYMHLNEVKVSSDQKVSKGDLIALSGNTGRSTGPHLHFQIEINGRPIDPLKFY